MHSSLHPRNFSKLPAHLRQRATAAYDGSVDDLIYLSDLTSGRLPGRKFLLPVFYRNLCDTAIPVLVDDLDFGGKANSEPFRSHIIRATLALQALSNLLSDKLVEADAFLYLWGRSWAWIQVLDTYREALPHLDPSLDPANCADVYATLIRGLGTHHTSGKVIDSTPGVRTVLVRTWSVLLREETTLLCASFGSICGLLEKLNT
ncbi:hypothetical protein C8R44DRAFT_856221, partial [Mycena epipterygia]